MNPLENRHGRRRLAAALALLLAWAAPAGASVAQGAADQPAADQPAAPEAPQKADQRTLRRLPLNWFRGFHVVYDRDSVAPLLAGGFASAGALAFDNENGLVTLSELLEAEVPLHQAEDREYWLERAAYLRATGRDPV